MVWISSLLACTLKRSVLPTIKKTDINIKLDKLITTIVAKWRIASKRANQSSSMRTSVTPSSACRALASVWICSRLSTLGVTTNTAGKVALSSRLIACSKPAYWLKSSKPCCGEMYFTLAISSRRSKSSFKTMIRGSGVSMCR
ncbi:Uncharacterised protein [Vibrio cholerae]|nr:Uncharacterised protein [Vibrio cholerae]CSC77256.1 Uncharacterised protein [Vibrio cholerae]